MIQLHPRSEPSMIFPHLPRVSLAVTVLAATVLLGLSACGHSGPSCEVWTYETRPGEEASRLYVCRIENYVADGKIYHVYIDGLQIPNPHAEGEEDKIMSVLAHLPLTEKAFRASVRERVDDDAPMPPFEEGFERWSNDFRNNRASAFDVPVKDCLDRLAEGLAK
jgi:hypothetical protein